MIANVKKRYFRGLASMFKVTLESKSGVLLQVIFMIPVVLLGILDQGLRYTMLILEGLVESLVVILLPRTLMIL